MINKTHWAKEAFFFFYWSMSTVFRSITSSLRRSSDVAGDQLWLASVLTATSRWPLVARHVSCPHLWVKKNDGYKWKPWSPTLKQLGFIGYRCFGCSGCSPGDGISWGLDGFGPSHGHDPQQELAAKSRGLAVVTRHSLGRFRGGGRRRLRRSKELWQLWVPNSMVWLKGKPHIPWENPWFPVSIFPETNPLTIFLKKAGAEELWKTLDTFW